MTYDRTDRTDVHDAATLEHYYQLLDNQLHLKGCNPIHIWHADEADLPASNPAQLTTRNHHPILAYRAGTGAEFAYFGGVFGRGYDGNGLTVTLVWMAATATSGSVVWAGKFERHHATHDIDSDGWGTRVEAAAALTNQRGSGYIQFTTIAFTDGAEIDSLAVGESFRLSIERDATDANDDMTGDAQLLRVVITETPE